MNRISKTVQPLMFLLPLALPGCSYEGGWKLPGVYRIDVQQGNVIEQEMVDKLKPGMNKRQVRFIMGTPALQDTFHSDRWEYVYTFSKSGGVRQARHLTLYFEEDKLARVEGDVRPAQEARRDDILQSKHADTVEVPLQEEKQGFFRKMFNILPFVGDDEPRPEPQPAQQEDESAAAEQPEPETSPE